MVAHRHCSYTFHLLFAVSIYSCWYEKTRIIFCHHVNVLTYLLSVFTFVFDDFHHLYELTIVKQNEPLCRILNIRFLLQEQRICRTSLLRALLILFTMTIVFIIAYICFNKPQTVSTLFDSDIILNTLFKGDRSTAEEEQRL